MFKTWLMIAACFCSLFIFSSHTQANPNSPNILVLIGDDMGTETLSMYGIGETAAVTPNLDKLASEGMRLDNFWAQPTCSPTRSAILTGRMGYQTGTVGPLMYEWNQLQHLPNPIIPANANKEIEFNPMGPVDPDTDPTRQELPLLISLLTEHSAGPKASEIMLPKVLKALPTAYQTAAVGKWHLTDFSNGDLNHPNDMGFDYYSGQLFGTVRSFYAWRHTENGKLTAESGYVDKRTVADAASWINANSQQPWFMWLSFINPHTPVHLPPTDLLHSEAKNLDPNALTADNTHPYFLAQIEAMDTLIGRLLAQIPQSELDNTYIIFLGDNGTVKWVQPSAPRNPERAKATVYEGGVNVPFIVKGPGIQAGSVASPLTHAADLFSTIIELAGGNVEDSIVSDIELDSISFAPTLLGQQQMQTRQVALAETRLGFKRSAAAKTADFKLLNNAGQYEFYDLRNDPFENSPLDLAQLSADAQQAYEQLKPQVDKILPNSPHMQRTALYILMPILIIAAIVYWRRRK